VRERWGNPTREQGGRTGERLLVYEQTHQSKFGPRIRKKTVVLNENDIVLDVRWNM